MPHYHLFNKCSRIYACNLWSKKRLNCPLHIGSHYNAVAYLVEKRSFIRGIGINEYMTFIGP